jgi:hypothetical protein
MITPELVNYIQLRIAKGHHLDIIRKDLFAYGGWTHDDVDQAFKSVGVSEQDVPMVSMESSVIKTGENKDEIISSQKVSYDAGENQQPAVNFDLGGNVSVSSEKDHAPLVEKDISETGEELSTVLDLDSDSLQQAGIESVTNTAPDGLNEKQMNDVAISPTGEEIAGISFESPAKEIPTEEPLQSVVEEKTPVAMPPVQPVDSFDPRIQPASIAVKETLVQEPVTLNTVKPSSYIPEPTIVPVGMAQEKPFVPPMMKTVESNIAPKPAEPVITPRPMQNVAQDWYTKSEPVAPISASFVQSTTTPGTPAFGGMAMTPDTQIYNDGVIIKKHNSTGKIIGITVTILLVLGIVGLGFYAYNQGLLSNIFNPEPVIESEVVEIPMAEQALVSLKNLLPINSGMQFSYVGSITSEKDIFASLFLITEDVSVISPVAEEQTITETPVLTPVESLLSIDGWFRKGDAGIQSEGNITLEIPRESGLERIRMKFILDREFAYVFFGEISPEALGLLNIEKDIWYRLPVVASSPETVLPKSVQTVGSVVQGISKALQSFSLQNPGTSSTIMNLPMHQYPFVMGSFDTDMVHNENDFIRTIKNISGALSLRENTFVPYNFSGSSNFDAMSVRHTISLVPLSGNQMVPVIPENVQILFPEIQSIMIEDENIQTGDTDTSSLSESNL